RFILYKYRRLTAKEIQQKIGLTRQTAYNYLNELEAQKLVQVEYERVSKKKNVKVAHYSNTPPRGEDFWPKEVQHLPLTERPKHTRISFDEQIRRINRILDMNMAAIIETKTAINRLTEKKFYEYYTRIPEADGFINFLILLNDEEFREYQKKMTDTLNQLWKKYESDEVSEIPPQNIHIMSFFAHPE
ncbi:MAG: MarR family transcriptional regulator, partial [Candidatus Hermodarchaeota archaeon]